MQRRNARPGRFWVAAALMTFVLLVPLAGANLVSDGGFETPIVPPGGYQCCPLFYVAGNVFGPWTVVGSASGNIALYNNTESVGSPPTLLNVEEGSQALDLTGGTDNGSATGVQQSFATTAGANYTVSLWVGAYFNQTASVTVNLNGAPFKVASYTSNDGNYVTQWQNFTYSFTATGATTTLSFLNNSPAGVSLVGLDNIDVEPAGGGPPPTPAPSTLILTLIGLAAAALFLTARRLAKPA